VQANNSDSMLEEKTRYLECLGATAVAGGFDEPIRVGGVVTLKDPSRFGVFSRGTINRFIPGSDNVSVSVHSNNQHSVVKWKCSDIAPVPEFSVDISAIKQMETKLVPLFVGILRHLRQTFGTVDISDRQLDIAWRLLKIFVEKLMLHWPSILDNQIIAVSYIYSKKQHNSYLITRHCSPMETHQCFYTNSLK
jgi:hypothetical protein